MPPVSDRPISTWERAEIARSGLEATLTPDDALRASPRSLSRFDRPDANTPNPLEYAFHLLGDVRGCDVLDVGCGSAGNTLVLAGRGARVWAIDISEELVRIGRRRMAVNGRAEGARFLVGSAHDLPLPDASVDVVFGMAILHHLDLARVSAEVYRVLTPGGRAIFQEPVRNSPFIRFLRSWVPYRAPDVSPFERPLTDVELRAFAAPFTAMRTRAFGLPFTALTRVVPGLRRYLERAYEWDGRVLSRFPRLGYYADLRVFEVTKPAVSCDTPHSFNPSLPNR